MDAFQAIALVAYDRMIGLELADLAIDGCITKAPCGGEVAGCGPVDRGKQGLTRLLAVDAAGPVGVIAAPANRHDTPLPGPTLDALSITAWTNAPRSCSGEPNTEPPPSRSGSPARR